MKSERQVQKEIIGIVSDYNVDLIRTTRNIQGSIDVELSHPIFYKENDKMEGRIRR